jgi:hypothetical protein
MPDAGSSSALVGDATAASTPYLAFPHLGGRNSMKSTAVLESDDKKGCEGFIHLPAPKMGAGEGGG